MRVLVTGANGHVGCNLVRELIGRGHTVVALVRPTADVRGLQGLSIERFAGDVLDPASVEAAAKDCDAVMNLAAIYKTGLDPAVIVQPAIDGIRNVLEVASRSGAKVVHTSSIVAVGTSDSPDVVYDETHWNDHPIDAYYKAKTDSERQAWALAKELGVPLVCVNPAAVLGAWDYRVTPSTGYIEQLAAGKQQTVRGALNYVDVRDVAFVHAEALERGTPGERYIVAGENLDFRAIADRIAALTGRPNPHSNLPRWAILTFATVVERVDRARGREPRMSRSGTSEVAGRWAFYDTTKARKAFGWTPRTAEDMLEHTIRWGIFMGRVPRDGFRGNAEPDPTWVK